jgi:hypothetical protein
MKPEEKWWQCRTSRRLTGRIVYRLRALLVAVMLIGCFAVQPSVASAEAVPEQRAIATRIPLRDGQIDTPTFIAAPAPAGLRAQSATFMVEYVNFPPDAQVAFQHAVNIWQELLTSPVPIRVVATWTSLPTGVLGAAGPTNAFRNFSGAPQPSTWYLSALANKLAGRDLDPNASDIEAEFNSNFSDWYFGVGQTPQGKSNFASTVVHELGHGLGFFGTADVDRGLGYVGISGTPDAYDRRVVTSSQTSILDFPNASSALAVQLQSNNLYYSGTATRAANNGAGARLYAPNPWDSGSSYAHLDEDEYPPGTINSLMTPGLNRAETVYHPGPLALGILADMGWTVTNKPAPSPSNPPTGQRCFPETRQCISGRFLAQWENHGGLAINGYPLTGERREKLEDGKEYLVQWFERVRMEYHPENSPPNDVLLGQFGRAIHPADPPVAQIPGQHYFPQTGHNVPNDFMGFWNDNGGLPQFGFPLSEVIVETLEDGKRYEVQYFERARLERHPQNNPPHNIQLGQFGRRILNGGPGPSPSPSPGANVIFQDDFTNPNSGWPTFQDPQGHFGMGYLPGEYRITIASANYYAISTNRTIAPQTNVRLEADMTRFGPIQEPLFGLVCRVMNFDNYYGAVIDTYGNAIVYKIIGRQYVELARVRNHPLIKRGNATNRLRFDCAGTQLALYANGTLIASAQDGDLASGYFGFVGYSYERGGLDLHIRNFIAYRP